MPDRLFEDLYRDTEGLRWATATQVRKRGRQLARRRTATGLAVAVVLVVAGAAGTAVALAGSGPSPELPDVVATAPSTPPPSAVTPSATPPTGGGPSSPTTSRSDPPALADRTGGDASRAMRVPADAMLRASDLAPGYRVDDPEHEGDWLLGFFAGLCDGWDSGGLSPVAYRERYFVHGRDGVQQRVERYTRTLASDYLPTLRANLRNCPEIGVDVVDEGFAGDESLLAVTDDRHGWIVVRRGDLVTQIAIDTPGDRAGARRLAERAALRLCAGTDRC
ncbi:hypothetical protein [Plantactinospora endophytica]|uniref:PknH-like extracellular domain-containing protein n=1 Tax=Plantactinospora endophytica TaxID=673535 RepID=A0ABQ4E2M1_9ACTN|nr:hypothetical protein [Plantactinospora endophytica]GIG88963.1 hypothetical protein Pen02_38990 [Plantactinospora endophytica]